MIVPLFGLPVIPYIFPFLFLLSSLLVTLSAGFIGGYVFYYIAMSTLPKENYGIFFGAVSGAAMAITYFLNWTALAWGVMFEIIVLVFLSYYLSLFNPLF